MKADTKTKSKVQWRQLLIWFAKHTLLEGIYRRIRADQMPINDQWAIQGFTEIIGCLGSPFGTKNKVLLEIRIWKDSSKPAIRAEPINQTDTNPQRSNPMYGRKTITMKEWNVMKARLHSRTKLRMEHRHKIGLPDCLRSMIALSDGKLPSKLLNHRCQNLKSQKSKPLEMTW